jgi:O-antigen ligase
MTMTTLTDAGIAQPTDDRAGAGLARPFVVFTVCLLPFLTPAGPGNTALADVTMAAALLLVGGWVVRSRHHVHFPYILGVGVLMLGGALAAVVSASPIGTVLVLAQDLLLVAWAIALAQGRHDITLVAAAVKAWCYTAVTVAAVFVASYLVGFTAVSGVNERDGARASYTFGDPNLAGNYLTLSFFLVVGCGLPRSLAARTAGALAILVAIAFTGSNGAVVTLIVGTAGAVALTGHHIRGALVGILLALGLVWGGLAAAAFVERYVDVAQVRERAAGSIPLLRDSLGRSDDSQNERERILQEGFDLYLHSDATGVGPAMTKSALTASQAPYVKEAHNDYLAALVERGALGAIGLLLLAFAIVRNCWVVVNGSPGSDRTGALLHPAVFVAIAPVVFVAANFYEVLHFRHLWTWLGLLAAFAALTHSAKEE